MGALISRWRKQASTIEILEQIDKDVENLEKLRKINVEKQRRLIGSLILYSVIGYIVTAVVIYLYYLPDYWVDRIILLTPLLLFPVLVWLLKKILHWYFVKRIAKNESALEELRERKKEILEEVMEKETYKKAKEILEKFDPERFKKLEAPKTPPAPSRTPEGQELRQRGTAQRPAQITQPTPAGGRGIPPGQQMATPHLPRPGPPPGGSIPQQNYNNSRGAAIPLPRPVLPRERTPMDRLVEYLVGDGPQNRYALICSQCHSHNGMALKEEFEYLSFRCCYCFTVNPARKRRPFAPRLQFTPPTARKADPQPQPATRETRQADENENSSHESSPGGSSEASKTSGEEDSEVEKVEDDVTQEVKTEPDSEVKTEPDSDTHTTEKTSGKESEPDAEATEEKTKAED